MCRDSSSLESPKPYLFALNLKNSTFKVCNLGPKFKIMKSKNVMTVSKFSESKHCFPACTPARFDKNFYRVSVSFGVVVVDFHAQGK